MPTIYLATPKNSDLLIKNEKLKYVVVKENEVTILNNKQYKPDFSYILTLEIGKSNAKSLKNHIKENIENLNIDYPAKFLELLKDNFDFQEQQELNQEELKEQENNSQLTTPKLDGEDENLLAAISQSRISTPTLPRPKSLNPDYNTEFSHKTFLSQMDLDRSNSPISFGKQPRVISQKLSSSQNSIHSQYSLERSEQAQRNHDEIYSFFSKKENKYLSNIKNHGLSIKKGYFNGEEKSKILLEITQLAEQIKEKLNEKGNESLIDQIDILKKKITDNAKTLSQYRGISLFKDIAQCWGGGRVKSIEYVNQLQAQLNTLTK